MDSVALSAALNGHPGCRCHDGRARMLAEIDGRDFACPTHSEQGRAAALDRARIDALTELAANARAEREQTVALNSPRLADVVRAALTNPTTESETTA